MFFGEKEIQFYKNILIKADLNLHQQIADVIIKTLPRKSKILDFGAGEGALSQRLHDLGYDMVAADIDSENFKAHDIIFKKINFNKREEVEKFIEEHKHCFDAVLGIETIEHLYNPWQYVQDLSSMLKPEGMLLLTTPNITSWMSRVQFLLNGRFHQFGDADLTYGHIAPITAWETQIILRSLNFHQITVQAAGTLPPLYLTGFNKLLIINMFALLLRPFMKGIKDGWCIMITARKSA